MDSADTADNKTERSAWGRVIAGFSFALTMALSAYMLINASSSSNVAFASLWFLAFFPAYLCALICYVGDPDGTRSRGFYVGVPPVFGSIVIVGSIVFLHEGVICLVMLSPLWLGFGWLGAWVMRRQRRRPVNPNTFRSALIFLPLVSGGIESRIPIAHDHVTLTREIVINATPDRIWPYAVANAHIDAGEGRWNFTQDILGLPRPRATVLHGIGKDGDGRGAVRTAYWGDTINFDENITKWEPGRFLGWSFSFSNSSLQNYTDKHIAPDGQFLKIDSGYYMITPLTDKTTRLTLRTNYIAKTHVNPYAELWGEILLGDIQNNILAIIKQRAEAGNQSSDRSPQRDRKSNIPS